MSTQQCDEVLRLLKDYGTVLLSGPPGCGKTRLLDEVAGVFTARGKSAAPATNLSAASPIPPTATPLNPNVPSPGRRGQVFKIVFHPGTKPRDFTCDLVPIPSANGLAFRVEDGELVKANRAALDPATNTASLLIIDELNRGPAVQLFGDLMTALERDKRLDQNNQVQPTSWPFRVRDANGVPAQMHLSPHLYILAAMNQADSSIEPLDLAFLRRWRSYRLLPDAKVVRDTFAIASPATAVDEVLDAAVNAWQAVNGRIEIGRGVEYQLGQGFFFATGTTRPASVAEAIERALGWWATIETHVLEAFFAQPQEQVAVFGSESGYQLKEATFGSEQRQVLQKPTITTATIVELLKQVASAPATP